VIYGAGDAGGLVIRELVAWREDARIVGFIDDDPRKLGIRVQGHPVLGGHSALAVLLKSGSIDAVVISARHMPPERLSNLELLCSEAGVRLSRLQVSLEHIVDAEESEPRRRTATLHQVKT
jgi:FlaA1/EpsC-like NDP-sugar epimerase